MRLQIGMHVKIIDDKVGFPKDAGKILKITKHQKDYDNKRAYELDNRHSDIFIEEDFEYCVEYPDLKID